MLMVGVLGLGLGGMAGLTACGSTNIDYTNPSPSPTPAPTPAVPVNPATVTAIASGQNIIVTWSAVAKATGYRIDRKDGAGGYIEVASVEAPTVTYIDKGLSAGTYTYRIRSVNTAGVSTGRETPSVSVVQQKTGEAPFGIYKGTSIAELKAMGATNDPKYPGVYILNTVPKPDKAIYQMYSVIATPTQGACGVIGISKDATSDSLGNEVRAYYNTIRANTTTKYGLGKNLSSIKTGSAYSEDKYWLFAIYIGDRKEQYYWGPEVGTKLPAPLVSIGTEVIATSSTKGYSTLKFEFDNYDTCYNEITGK